MFENRRKHIEKNSDNIVESISFINSVLWFLNDNKSSDIIKQRESALRGKGSEWVPRRVCDICASRNNRK